MDLVGKLALLLTPGFVQGAGSGPTAAPSNPTVEVYGPDLWRIMWDTGDVLAHTRVQYADIDGAYSAGLPLAGNENPGVTSTNSPIDASGTDPLPAQANDHKFWVYHIRNGQESAKVGINSTSV